MKKVIYALLIATSITQTAVYATQKPQRPTTPLPTEPTKLSPEVCPPDLDTDQLNEIKAGTLKLQGHNFKLHTSEVGSKNPLIVDTEAKFNAMLPSKWQIISKGSSLAHIGVKGTASTLAGPIVSCQYHFRTALGSKVLHKDPKSFSIESEPQEGKSLPEGLAEAIAGAETSKKD